MPFAGTMQALRCPIYAEILRVRALALTVSALAAGQLVASNLGYGMGCTFHHMLGIPCPGCGLTRSVLALCHGHLGESLYLHPLGPILAAGAALGAVTVFLPRRARERMTMWVARVESVTALPFLMMALLMVIWGLRLAGWVPLAQV